MRLTEKQKQTAETLRWHWGTVAADSGLRSSHSALVAMIESGGAGPSGRSSYDANMVDRVDRKKGAQNAHLGIESTLKRLSPKDQAVLFLSYGGTAPPLIELGKLARLRDLARVAQLTDLAQRRHKAARSSLSVWNWLITAKAQKNLPLNDLETEVEALVRAAHKAYEAAREEAPTRRALRTRRRPEAFSAPWSYQ